jgi:ATP-dependent helicase/DNAse subunit B
VLTARLTELVQPPPDRREGRIFVAPIEAARGRAFDVVFVPGLAEKIFPQKVMEDPIVRDELRRRIAGARPDEPLETREDRVARERLALHLAVGAARRRLVISYPRVDMDQSRPRVPSFYGLELLRAAEGRLPGFGELIRRAEQGGGAARIGWPAPARPQDAIDAAEHDLALLETLFHQPEEQTIGTARYLLSVNPHLARALRFRARRWIPAWTSADGLYRPIPEAREALKAHSFEARSFSPTALQHFAACPYRFYLYAVHKLGPREVPEAIEEMNPLQRGSLVHEALYEVLVSLRNQGRLPITPDSLEDARAELDRMLDHVAARFKDELAPAIERVWADGIASVRADLREWLRRAAEDDEWEPLHFELSFGLPSRRSRDPASAPEPVLLDCGVKLRGSIDLVERSRLGAVRATDYKTGRVRTDKSAIVAGGETLQPVLYALVLEKIMPPGTEVHSGRLYYCTSAGSFTEVPILLNERARKAAAEVVATIGDAIDQAALPAIPAEGACTYCDYRPVCGPYEELRVGRIKRRDLDQRKKLDRLRRLT